MKKFLNAASFLALVSFAYPATALSVYEFSLDGWSDGGSFSGSFTAEDFNNDGQISSFDEEVTAFSGTYLSSQFASITFESLDGLPFGGEIFNDGPIIGAATGLVFTLDGSGQLGDDFFGAVEGLGVYGRTSGSDFGNDVYLAVGPGPFNQCTGDVVCGGVFDAFNVGFPIATQNEEPPVAALSSTIETDGGQTQERTEVTAPLEIGFLPVEAALATNTAPINVTGDLGEPDAQFESTPVLPSDVNEDGGFVFNLNDIRILPREIFFIDPEIATGYTYEITGGLFFSVQAPSLDAVDDADGQYLLTFDGQSVVLAAGELFEFGQNGVSSFIISGIDPGLDPTDPTAFVTGVSVINLGPLATITQTPITEEVNPVPLPAGGVLLLTGLAGLALVRRRRTAHDA